MTDKKFTDEEIIRNYEWCIGCTSDRCRECTMDEEGFCEEELQDLVLDLINRQKAEIERLKSELLNTRRKALLEASSKFAGHSNYHGDTILCKLICMAEGQEVGMAIPLDMSEMKAKAYKEFAEKAAIELANAYSSEYAHWIDVTLNNLLEELVGENE